MRWRRVGPDHERIVRDFLAEREADCTAAVSRFKELAACGLGAKAPGAAWGGFSVDDEGSAKARSLVVAMKSGVVSVVFDDPAHPANRRALERILAGRKISSIQGLASDVALAESVLAERMRASPLNPFFRRPIVDPIDYSLMKLETAPRPEALSAGPAGLVVRRAFPEDAELLFPLQAAYEKEEVVPAGGVFSAAGARLAFERAIRERVILYAVLDGKAVGKAGTNARAFTRDQIGGVFVDPEYRGRGIAARLVAELSALLRAEGRTAVLFVKKRNAPARAAYEKVGFVAGENYRITYYTEKGT